MSEYSETLETSEDGRYRVRLVLDEYPDEPYDDGQSPLMRLAYRYYGWRAEHIMATGRPLDADEYVEAAAQRWGTDFGLLEKYLRAYHGATKVETWHSGDYWYITYDTAAWREYIGVTADKAEAWLADHSGSINMSEYRAYCEGDVWYYVVERNVTWHRDDDPDETMATWESVDSCGGYYGSDGANGEYLRECAREALGYAVEDSKPEPAPLIISQSTGVPGVPGGRIMSTFTPSAGPVCEAADWLANCEHPDNGESSCYAIQEDAMNDYPAVDPDLQAGYDSARQSYGDRYADYLIQHDRELRAKGHPLTAWPHSLQGNDGD